MKYVWVTPFHMKTSDIWDFLVEYLQILLYPGRLLKSLLCDPPLANDSS